MYRSVIYSLSVLFVFALFFTIIGSLPFSPLSLFASALVLVLGSVVVNYAIAYVFGTRSHVESAITTGLILTFMFSPARDVSEYVSLLLVAIIAMATKYIVAWRKRHIANPAALAAAIVSLVGVQAATWWVATGPLIIPTILFGTFLLYKTNRLTMGYVYIVVAAVTTILVSMLSGQSFVDIAKTVLISYPILYLAFYMLSEPLTQAPRNYQRNLLAAGIAILANAQIVIYGFGVTPELALVVGNIIAFLLTQRGEIKLEFLRKEKIAEQQWTYYFKPKRKLHFEAGQYLELTLFHEKADDRGVRRRFTISSSPRNDEVSISVRHNNSSSSFKKALFALKPGVQLRATSINGDFLLPKNSARKVLMIAGGIGVTPFLSQLSTLKKSNERCDITLLYFVAKPEFAVDLTSLKSIDGINVEIVTDFLSKELLTEKVGDISERATYISGPPRMVDAGKKLARSLNAKSVKTDLFEGY